MTNLNNIKEIWVPVFGFENVYEVSNLGALKRLPRWSKNSRNNSLKFYREKIKRFEPKFPAPKRYVSIKLTWLGVTYYMDFHRLIMLSFSKGIPFTGAVVNHIDGNKSNSQLSNLEWVTPKQNIGHANDTGLSKYAYGESAGLSKLTNLQVLEIKELRWKKGWTCKNIAKLFGVSGPTVSYISCGLTWRHI